MQAQLTQRLTDLKAEYQAGQKMLADLEAKKAEVRDTLLRISGAIQVLEEELTKATPAATLPTADASSVPASATEAA